MNKQFKKVKAIFNPKITKDLTDEAIEFIGKEILFQYSWIMDDDEIYHGIWALIPVNGEMGWVPEFDLKII